MIDRVKELRNKAESISASGTPVVRRARQRALEAVDVVASAVVVDPTLLAVDRRRGIDLLDELMRQLRPLARHAEVELRRRELAAGGATEETIAALGRTYKVGPEELEALSARCGVIAAEISAAALPDWDTPRRVRERSERLLPSAGELEEIAGQLRRAVKRSLDLSHPHPEAVRLAALADQITLTTEREGDKS